MRVAVLLRGPIRPTIPVVRNNIEIILGDLRNHFDVTSFLSTWSDQPYRELVDLIDFVDAADPPPYRDMGRFPEPCLCHRFNTVLQFHGMRHGLRAIPRGFDRIFYTRTDYRTVLGPHAPAWLEPGVYNTAHVEPFLCDQVAMADEETMRSTWGFDDTLEERIMAAARPEDVLSQYMAERGLTATECQMAERTPTHKP